MPGNAQAHKQFSTGSMEIAICFKLRKPQTITMHCSFLRRVESPRYRPAPSCVDLNYQNSRPNVAHSGNGSWKHGEDSQAKTRTWVIISDTAGCHPRMDYIMKFIEEQEIHTAYHEAGHAVAGILLGGRNILEGDEATEIIVEALAAKGTIISPPELSACSLELPQSVQ